VNRLAVTAAALLMLVPAAAEAATRTRVKHTGHDVTVRNAPPGHGAGYVVGTARRGVAFDVVGSANKVDHGFVWGNLNHCGWVFPGNLDPAAGTAKGKCPAGATHRYSFGSFSNGERNCQPGHCSDGSSAHVDYEQPGCLITGQVGKAYANVNPFLTASRPRDQYGVLPDEAYVLWRYVSRDGQWVMVHDKSVRHRAGFPAAASDWYFVNNHCLRRS
jgi:hypothetical protein